MNTAAWLVVGFGVVAVIVVLAAYIRVGAPIRTSAPESHRRDVADQHHGPTGTAYPPGSRPAGPGAEGMNVSGSGDISPGPRPAGTDDSAGP